MNFLGQPFKDNGPGVSTAPQPHTRRGVSCRWHFYGMPAYASE